MHVCLRCCARSHGARPERAETDTMVRPGIFLVFVAALIGAISIVQGALPEEDPFLVAGARGAVFLDDRSGSSFAALKLRHMLSRDRFDIALFGNSRSLDVGAEHLR